MNKKPIIIFIILIFSGFLVQALAQFTPEEIAQRPKWEEFLKTAKITASDQPWAEREAVTHPWRLTLEKDGLTQQAIWKNPEGRLKGYFENWKWEIAAYRLDKYLGLNMVPPTVERRFRENRGSCQLLVDFAMTHLPTKYSTGTGLFTCSEPLII